MGICCKIQGNPKLVLCDNLEGGMGTEVGRSFKRERDICLPMVLYGRFMLMSGRDHHNVVK